LIWILLLIAYIIAIYDNYYWIYGESYNRWISAFLYPTTRIIWALNTATLIWMCITGNGGLVNKFLTLKVFIPLSRLTYSVYLTHIYIVWIYWCSRRELVDVNSFQMISMYFEVVLMSFIIGAVFSLFFESPFLNLQKYLKDYLIGYKKDRNKTYIRPSQFSESIESSL
jgi:peptidoglycan/LPS O-acetylase OafA/YrhL